MTGVFGVVLGQILLMFLYLIIGYVLYRTGLITQEGSKALAHLLLYCVLPCVVLKSFCIEYSAKGAVELAVSIAAGAGVLLLSMAVSWLFFRKDPMWLFPTPGSWDFRWSQQCWVEKLCSTQQALWPC